MFLNLIRVTKIDEMLNIRANTKNKKIKLILKQLEKKKKIKNCKIYHINHSEKLSSTNYCWGVILKAIKDNYE